MPAEMLYVEILLGSNTSNRHHNIHAATDSIYRILIDPAISPILDSPDFTGKGADYLNRVIAGYIPSHDLCILKSTLKNIENALGRDRSTPHIVELDADLVTISDTASNYTEINAPREFATTIFQDLRIKP